MPYCRQQATDAERSIQKWQHFHANQNEFATTPLRSSFGQQPCTKNSMTRRGSAKGSLDSRKRRQGRRGEALSRRFYTYNVEHRARWRRQPKNRRRSSISHAKIPRPTVIASTPSPPPPPMPQSLLQWLSSSERSAAIVADNKSVIIASRRANTTS